jgi:hypothetical protein
MSFFFLILLFNGQVSTNLVHANLSSCWLRTLKILIATVLETATFSSQSLIRDTHAVSRHTRSPAGVDGNKQLTEWQTRLRETGIGQGKGILGLSTRSDAWQRYDFTLSRTRSRSNQKYCTRCSKSGHRTSPDQLVAACVRKATESAV